MQFDYYISELNGYLTALQRLSGVTFSFGAKSYYAKENIDEFLKNYLKEMTEKEDISYGGRLEINYKELIVNIKKYIFNGFLSAEKIASANALSYLERTLIEDINEYYGLASNSLNESGTFHPLVEGPVYSLKIKNSGDVSSLYFMVKIESYYVITCFCQKVRLG